MATDSHPRRTERETEREKTFKSSNCKRSTNLTKPAITVEDILKDTQLKFELKHIHILINVFKPKYGIVLAMTLWINNNVEKTSINFW